MQQLNAIAYHLGERINLPDVRQKQMHHLVKREQSFLFYKIDTDSFLYYKDYGSVVFINCSNDLIKKSIELATSISINIEKLRSEKFLIKIEKESEITIDFDSIQLPKLEVDFAHIIMLNIGQSVALDNYYNTTKELLEDTRRYALQLENKGNIKLSHKQMKKFIGKTMNIKNRIAENIFIFESPALAWNTEDLSTLDLQLKRELDMVDRHHGLQHNLSIVKENLDLFKDILHHKYRVAF